MITEVEQYKELYEKAFNLSLIQKEQINTLQKQGALDVHTINSVMEINILLRNCHNCNKQKNCKDVKCFNIGGFFPSWKMRIFK